MTFSKWISVYELNNILCYFIDLHRFTILQTNFVFHRLDSTKMNFYLIFQRALLRPDCLFFSWGRAFLFTIFTEAHYALVVTLVSKNLATFLREITYYANSHFCGHFIPGHGGGVSTPGPPFRRSYHPLLKVDPQGDLPPLRVCPPFPQ